VNAQLRRQLWRLACSASLSASVFGERNDWHLADEVEQRAIERYGRLHEELHDALIRWDQEAVLAMSNRVSHPCEVECLSDAIEEFRVMSAWIADLLLADAKGEDVDSFVKHWRGE
jgi:hypothetical protein